jgi:hypothetical protein
MKTTSLVLALLASCACAVLGQEAKGGDTATELQAPKKEPQEQKAVVTPPTTKTNVLGTEITYGGYLTDLKRAEKKRPLFSLKSPPDPKKDMENLWFYPGTDKISGVVLFSIKF